MLWTFHTWDRNEPEQGFSTVKKRISAEYEKVRHGMVETRQSVAYLCI